MMINILAGFDPITGKPFFRKAHPFLAGARKQLLSVPDVDRLGRKCTRSLPDGATKPVRFERPNYQNIDNTTITFGARQRRRAAERNAK